VNLAAFAYPAARLAVDHLFHQPTADLMRQSGLNRKKKQADGPYVPGE